MRRLRVCSPEKSRTHRSIDEPQMMRVREADSVILGGNGKFLLGLKLLASCLFALTCVFPAYGAREIHARRAAVQIRVDGRIENNEWPESLFQSGFTQMEPRKGEPSTETTRVAVQFDEDHLYVAFICLKSYPDPVVAEQTRRDQLEKVDDVVAVCLDTYHDLRSAYWFMSNCLNTQVDMRISDDAKYTDINWDGGWTVKTAVGDRGYTAEFAIPFKTIRFSRSKKSWGINFGRFIPKTLETSYWSGALDVDFRVSQSGLLTGLELPEVDSEFHIIPYVTARVETFSGQSWNLCNGTDQGLDVEFRYRSNITGNATVNPDFATVEGDRERINMTRWELSFPEKRKFFLEGSEMFQNRIQAYYSRRTGEIDFGGKTIGKVGPYAFAVIGVKARAVDDNPVTSDDESFPQYYTGVFRMKRDVFKSSTVGMLFVDKEWDGGFNRVLSLDGVFHFPGDFHFTTQFVAGAPGPLKENYGGFVRLVRENNIYHYHLRYTELGERLKESVNGVGFIRDDDRRELDSAVRYKWWVKKSGVEYLYYFSNYNIYWSKTDGQLRSWEIVQELSCYLSNKFSLSTEFVRDYQLFEKGFNNHSIEVSLGYNTEEWSASELNAQFGRNFDRNFWMITGSTKFKIHDKLSAESELRRLDFDPDPSSESTWLGIATINYQFTPDLFIRLFTQYRSSSDRIYVYGLFGWRYKLPNSALYVVYTRDDFDRTGLERKKNEIFFFKCAYDFVL